MKTTFLILCVLLLSLSLAGCGGDDIPEDSLHFTLKYKFKMTKVAKGRFRIALPQNIPGIQKIHRLELSPKPSQVKTQDGESYAEFIYMFPKDTTIEIRLEAYFSNLYSPGEIPQLKNPDEIFLKSEQYIEFDDPRFIENLPAWAQSHDFTPTKVLLDSTFSWVKKYLKPSKFNWEDKGLLQAIQTRKGDCTEYTDVTVGLCRFLKIPAQAHSGFVVYDNQTQAHSFGQCGEFWMDPLLYKNRNKTPAPTIILSSTRNPKFLLNKRFLHFDWVKGNIEMLGYPKAKISNYNKAKFKEKI